MSCCSFDFSSDGKADSKDGSRLESNGLRSQHGYHSSSNSNNSSISSISSSSSDSDYRTSGAADLEADADSLTCRRSGLSSIDQLHTDSLKPVLSLHILKKIFTSTYLSSVKNIYMTSSFLLLCMRLCI